MINISDLINIFKLPVRKIIPIVMTFAVLSTILILLPDSIAFEIGLNKILTDYKTIIGIIAISAYSFFIAYILFWIIVAIVKKVKRQMMIRLSKRALKKLSTVEKRVLSQYIIRESKSCRLRPQDGIASSLEEANIIYLAYEKGHVLNGFSYNLYPWIWDEINNKPELLEPELSNLKKQQKLNSGHRR